jgi:hypothetical protein
VFDSFAKDLLGLERGVSFAGGVLLTLGSWFVPGVGFVIQRDYWRGVAIFLLINGTFLLGLLLHGTILIPEFHYSSPAFNIVNLLTFAGQIGNAGASLFCLVHDQWNWRVFQPIETDPRFDLATLYLLVSGCMNYFCVCSFYDRHVGAHETDDKPAKDNP